MLHVTGLELRWTDLRNVILISSQGSVHFANGSQSIEHIVLNGNSELEKEITSEYSELTWSLCERLVQYVFGTLPETGGIHAKVGYCFLRAKCGV